MYQTLDPENKFEFVCPIFNAQTKMSTCVKLRNMVWQGKTPDARKGCQACMSIGKCPAAVITQKMAMSNARNMVEDDYGSTKPVVGRIRADVLEKILPAMHIVTMIDRFCVSPEEFRAIETANERIEKALNSAPKNERSKTPIAFSPSQSPVKKRASAKKTPLDENLKNAAVSGDISAAINKE
jgi:hypothetical protein